MGHLVMVCSLNEDKSISIALILWLGCQGVNQCQKLPSQAQSIASLLLRMMHKGCTWLDHLHV